MSGKGMPMNDNIFINIYESYNINFQIISLVFGIILYFVNAMREFSGIRPPFTVPLNVTNSGYKLRRINLNI